MALTNAPLAVLQAEAAKGNSQAQTILGWRYYNGNGVAKNLAEATNWWGKAAEQDDSTAMTALAGAIFQSAFEAFSAAHARDPVDPATGLGGTFFTFTNIPKECLNWYRKAAALEDTNAIWRMVWLEKLYSPMDPATGLLLNSTSTNLETTRWLLDLASRGDPEAMVELGSRDLDAANSDEGLKWLHTAADLGAPSAWAALGSAYERGTGGVTQNPAEAIAWYTKSATKGDDFSAMHLAEIYSGDSDERNLQEAFKWNLLEAQRFEGDTNHSARLAKPALVEVAKAYDKGTGVAEDKAAALYWYTKSAEAGDAEGQWHLGVIYDLGEGVDIDKKKALQWYLKAASTPTLGGLLNLPGVVEAQRNLGFLYQDGTAGVKDLTRAFDWFMKAAKSGDGRAQYEVAESYNAGIGVLQDKEKALEWYRRAAYNGQKLAQFELGNLFSENLHSSRDRIEAYKWYTLAAANGEEDGAKFRDIVAGAMSARELAEANSRARSFSVGPVPESEASVVP